MDDTLILQFMVNTEYSIKSLPDNYILQSLLDALIFLLNLQHSLRHEDSVVDGED